MKKSNFIIFIVLFLFIITIPIKYIAEESDVTDFAIIQEITIDKFNYSITPYIIDISWSPDGTKIAASYSYDIMVIWDVETGTPLKTYFDNSTWHLAWSPDGSKIASADNETIVIWDAENDYIKLKVFKSNCSQITSLDWSYDSELVAVCSGWGEIEIWEVATGKCIRTMDLKNEMLFTIEFSPDDNNIATGSDEGNIRIWNVITGICIKTINAHQEKIFTLEWSPDGKMLASGSGGTDNYFYGEIKIWETMTYTCIQTFPKQSHYVQSISWHPDCSKLAVGVHESEIKIWDTKTWKVIRVLDTDFSVESVTWDKKGERLAVSIWSSTFAIFGHTPDLQIVDNYVQISSQDLDIDDVLIINFTIQNNGSVNAENITIGFYADSRPFLMDKLIHNESISNLNAKEKISFSVKWNTSEIKEINETFRGNVYIKLKIDPENSISEFNETNNDYELEKIYIHPQEDNKIEDEPHDDEPSFIPTFESYFIIITFGIILILKIIYKKLFQVK